MIYITQGLHKRNSYSKSDVDATFMRMKDDHMRNGQLKPGYNVQMAVDSEYIVVADIFQDRNDVGTFVPLMCAMEENLRFCYPSITTDAGYESEEAYDFLAKRNQQPFIKPKIYEQQKTRKFKQDISKRENMFYDQENDYYICHNGKKILPIDVKTQKSKSGYESEITVYECEDCIGCPHRELCTKSEGNRQIQVSKNFDSKRKKSKDNINSETGIIYRKNRSIQVEGAFGVLKQDYEFQRFMLRGKNKVKLEILLLCLGYNINKFHRKIQDERLQSYLFEVKVA
jgi:transposase